MKQKYDIVVMGAGMVGATVAVGLARAGLRIAVVDTRPPEPIAGNEAPRLRVSAISYASEQILRNLEVWSLLDAQRLCPYRRLAVNEQKPRQGLARHLPDISTWARTEFRAEEVGLTHLGHILENEHLQCALHTRFDAHDNLTLLCPAQAREFDLEGSTKRVVLETGETLEARMIIGAEGAQSPVRQAAGLGQYREQYAQSAFACTVAYRGDQQDITWQTFRPEGPVAFLPLASTDNTAYASLVWYDAPEKISSLMQASEHTLLKELRQHFPSNLPRLESIAGRGAFPLFKSHVFRYYCPGVALVGDAAHTINPLAGQGVNLGLMDAAVLIELIAQAALANEAWWDVDILAGYEKRRRAENQRMMSMMDLFYHGFSNQHLPVTVLRNLGLGLAQRSGPVKRKVLSYAVGLAGDKPRLAEPA